MRAVDGRENNEGCLHYYSQSGDVGPLGKCGAWILLVKVAHFLSCLSFFSPHPAVPFPSSGPAAAASGSVCSPLSTLRRPKAPCNNSRSWRSSNIPQRCHCNRRSYWSSSVGAPKDSEAGEGKGKVVLYWRTDRGAVWSWGEREREACARFPEGGYVETGERRERCWRGVYIRNRLKELGKQQKRNANISSSSIREKRTNNAWQRYTCTTWYSNKNRAAQNRCCSLPIIQRLTEIFHLSVYSRRNLPYKARLFECVLNSEVYFPRTTFFNTSNNMNAKLYPLLKIGPLNEWPSWTYTYLA